MPFGNRKKAIKEQEQQQQQQQSQLKEKSIDINAEMQGTLKFNDPVDLKINGEFKGSLDIKGSLTIGKKANVEADILGENVIVSGKVKGNVTVSKMLVLMPTAVLDGNIKTPKLNIVEGAVFQGNCVMLEDVLSINQLAEYLEIQEPDIVELVNSGKIPAMKEGSSYFFERAKIDVWASSGRV